MPQWETWATPPVPSQEIRSQSEEAVVPEVHRVVGIGTWKDATESTDRSKE